tara:strand:+ start:261 stop:899 length:639 start_codon:yes stop_codon:yes gene_type:complete
MVLAAREREFVAATANHYSDDWQDEFIDSGRSGSKESRRVRTSRTKDVHSPLDAASEQIARQHGMAIYPRMSSLAGAMVAATFAFSPHGYAADTRPTFCAADTLYAKKVSEHESQPAEASSDTDLGDPELIERDALAFSHTISSLVWQPESWVDDGEAVFEWITDGKHAIVSIEGDGTFAYAMYREGGFVPGLTEGPSVSEIPEDLVAYLVA